MLQLQPQGEFTVVRQIANHIDTDTYYVRAVIRYAYTDVLIENLDLTSRGSQRFSKNWRAPADVSGQGYWISIVTSVYTDSGYTTKSENYGDEENTYLVQERVLGSLKSGAGGGLDMRTTRRVVSEEIAKIKFPEQKEYDNKFSELSKGLEDIKALVGSLPAENNDLSPIKTKLDTLSQEIKTKPITPKTDLTKIEKQLSGITKDTYNLITETTKIKKDTSELIGDKKITLNIQPIQMEVESKQETKKFNINNLAK